MANQRKGALGTRTNSPSIDKGTNQLRRNESRRPIGTGAKDRSRVMSEVNQTTWLYSVQKGDSLWTIAAKHLGHGDYWDELAVLNQIGKPNQIFVGQKIKIPMAKIEFEDKSSPLNDAALPTSSLSGKERARPVYFPTFKYDFDKHLSELILVETPQVEIKIKLKGNLTVQDKKFVTNLTFTKEGIEAAYKQETDLGLLHFMKGVKFSFKPPGDASIYYESSVGTKEAWTKYSLGYTTQGELKLSVTPKEVELDIASFDSGAVKAGPFCIKGTLGFEITIKPKVDTQMLMEVAAVVGVSLAAVIIVATIAEDIVTLGAGIADDPVSFAAAAALLRQSLPVLLK